MKQNDFRKGGIVSIWIGNFASDIELDDYLDLNRKFEEDFGFEMNDRDPPEVVVRDSPMTIAELAEGFSWGKSFLNEVAQFAAKNSIEKATTMIVFFNLQYDPQRAAVKMDAPLKYLGAFHFS